MSRVVLLAALAFSCITASKLIAQTYTDKIATTPVYIQDGFGAAGNNLPYGGSAYCFPTGFAMSLSYLGINGFNQIAPANPTTADGLNLVKVLSGLAGTDSITGTASNPGIYTAVQTYLAAKGISTSNYTLTATSSPTLSQLSSLNQANTVVDLGLGYYDVTSGDRNGGHCVVLLSQGMTAQGQSSPNTIIVNNPAPSAFLPVSDQSANSLQYLNTITTAGTALSGDGAIMLDPNQSPGFWGNTRAVVEAATSLSINASQLSTNNPTPATWTLTTTQSINLGSSALTSGGYLSVLAPIAGSGGISKGSGGMMEMFAADNSTGGNVLTSGIWQSDVVSGHPFGSGSFTIKYGTLQLMPASRTADINLVMADGSGNTLTYTTGGATLSLNRNGNNSLTFTIGGNTDGSTANLVRSTNGTLIIAAGSGIANLGTATLAGSERLFISGSGGNLPTLTNGIVNTSIIGQNNDANATGDFLTYGTYGFAKAGYTLASNTAIASAGASAVYEANVGQTLATGSAAQVYALKVDAVTISGAGGTTTLTVGSQTSGKQSGLILNGGTLSTTNLNFGASEATIYTSNAGGTINAIVQGSGGITTFGPGALTLTAANTYTGTTNINSGSTLVAANTTGSATGGSTTINIRELGTLQINANATAGKSSSTTNLVGGSTLALNGGTIAGTVTMTSGLVIGQGTFSGNVTFTGGTIAATGNTVNNITFSGTTTNITNTIYTWQLNALTDNPVNAGVNWSILHFTTPTYTTIFGNSGTPINYNLALGTGVADPNSGNAFWNSSHTWLVAQNATEFNEIYYDYAFPAYSQGSFSMSVDSTYEDVYINYTPTAVPEPSGFYAAVVPFLCCFWRFQWRREPLMHL